MNRAGVYITKPSEIKLYSVAARALKLLADKGYRLIVLTNQSGIARGYFTLSTAKKMNLQLRALLAEKGVKLTAAYMCPHSPGAGCACRKPRIGLLKEALKDFKTRMSASLMIGDKACDAGLAINAGIKPVLVATGQGTELLKSRPADLKGVTIHSDILAAARSAANWSEQGKPK